MGEDVSKRIMGPATAVDGNLFAADGTTGKKAKAYTAAQAKTFLAIASADLAFAATKTTATRTIYVDSAAAGANDGTSWTDAFTTIQAAFDAIPPIINHAVTVYIKRGTGTGANAKYYREQAELRGKYAGAALGSITIQAHNGTDPQTDHPDYIRITGATSGTDPSADTPVREAALIIATCRVPVYVTAVQADCAGTSASMFEEQGNIIIRDCSFVRLYAVYSVYASPAEAWISGVVVAASYVELRGDCQFNNNSTGLFAKRGAFVVPYSWSDTPAPQATNCSSSGFRAEVAIIVCGSTAAAWTASSNGANAYGFRATYGSLMRLYCVACVLDSSTAQCVNASNDSYIYLYGNCTYSNAGAGGTKLPSSGANLVNTGDPSAIYDAST
jgi:hypothetical protein